jgi:hypothetical protein
LNWNYLKGLFYEYWYHAAFLLLVFAVVSVSIFYVRGQFERRRERLRTLHLYEIDQRGETVPRVADLDRVINDVLFPQPDVYLPLVNTLSTKVNWGPEIRHWSRRQITVPFQSAPSLRGPE